MGTKQLSNKKSQNSVSKDRSNFYKSLFCIGLQRFVRVFPLLVSRETLVTYCKQRRYDGQMAIMALSDPITFLPSSAVGNGVKLSLSPPSKTISCYRHLGLVTDLNCAPIGPENFFVHLGPPDGKDHQFAGLGVEISGRIVRVWEFHNSMVFQDLCRIRQNRSKTVWEIGVRKGLHRVVTDSFVQAGERA
jgi:hypothetical protein